MRVGCTQDGGLLCWLIEESRSYPSAAVSVARSVSRHKTGSETLVVIENLASIDRFPSAVCRYVFAGVSRLKDSMVLDAVVRFCSELVKWRSTPPLCELWASTRHADFGAVCRERVAGAWRRPAFPAGVSAAIRRHHVGQRLRSSRWARAVLWALPREHPDRCHGSLKTQWPR